VFAADLDGDRDVDVLSASDDPASGIIAWYENADGKGTFGDQHVIRTTESSPRSVYAADVDGDGDMDVLSASFNEVGWFENTDGKGTFGEQEVITPQGFFLYMSLYAADLDADGDVDMLSASLNEPQIAWYENSDGKGAFGEQKAITTSADGATGVYAADVDGDGDMDVLSASSGDNKIAWYENTDGKGTFGEQRIVTRQATFALSVYAADVDGDGDVDVLSASRDDDKIAWYENTDGKGTFGQQKTITTSADAAAGVYAADVDGDGDMDVLSASYRDNKIAWYENLSPHVAAGDANRDMQFDQQDIVLVLQAAKYLTGQPATFEEGDWNGDGVFDQLDIVAALQTGNYLRGPYAVQSVEAAFAES
jgi:hypothetical protein